MTSYYYEVIHVSEHTIFITYMTNDGRHVVEVPKDLYGKLGKFEHEQEKAKNKFLEGLVSEINL